MGGYPPGFGSTDTAVIFPQSRRAALMGTFEGPEFEHHVSRDFVARNNPLVIAHAKEQVYAWDNIFPYLNRAA